MYVIGQRSAILYGRLHVALTQLESPEECIRCTHKESFRWATFRCAIHTKQRYGNLNHTLIISGPAWCHWTRNSWAAGRRASAAVRHWGAPRSATSSCPCRRRRGLQ